MLRHNEWIKQRELKEKLTITTKHKVINGLGETVAEFDYLLHALEYLESKENGSIT